MAQAIPLEGAIKNSQAVIYEVCLLSWKAKGACDHKSTI